MKSILSGLFVLVLLGAESSMAQFVSDSVNLCENGRCTQEMSAIQGDFDSGVEFNPLLTGPSSFYSGSCYHQISNLDAKKEHHGAFTFWRDENDAMHFNGVFSFFAGKNPYEGMTSEEGFKYIRSRSSKPYPVREEPTFGHVIMTGEKSRLDYWMRTNADGSEMNLLSLWVTDRSESRSFCHLKRH